MPSRWVWLNVPFDVGVGTIDVELDEEGEGEEVNEGDNDIVEDDEVGVAADVEGIGSGVEEEVIAVEVIAVEGIAGEVVTEVGSVTVCVGVDDVVSAGLVVDAGGVRPPYVQSESSGICQAQMSISQRVQATQIRTLGP